MTFVSFCSSVKEKFIKFTSKIFKSKKVGDNKFGNKFDSNGKDNIINEENRTERLLRSVLLRLNHIETKLTILIEEKNKEIEETFDKTSSNKRYKCL
jgi:hypothetical protein